MTNQPKTARKSDGQPCPIGIPKALCPICEYEKEGLCDYPHSEYPGDKLKEGEHDDGKRN